MPLLIASVWIAAAGSEHRSTQQPGHSEHGLTAYDAAYVAAARKHGWTLESSDLKDLVKPGPTAALHDPQL